MRLLHLTFRMPLLSGCSTVENWTTRINSIHERALRLVYKDTLSFDDLLATDNSFKIHQRNLQKLAIEIFKVKKGIAPAIMNNILYIYIYTHTYIFVNRFLLFFAFF